MKAVDLLLDSILPDDLKGPRTLDKKGIDNLLAEIALKHPERYEELVQNLSDIGRNGAYIQGQTITLDDMKSPIDKEAILAEMDKEVSKLQKTLKGPALEKAVMGVYGKYAGIIEKETIAGALRTGNNIGNTVISGARGNPTQLKGMLTTPGLYTDYLDNVIPHFVRRSFGEGLRPVDYLASTYGVRKAVMSTKNATARAGDLSKQLASSSGSLHVTEDDCGTSNGIMVPVDDPDLKYRVLARDAGGIKAGEIVDKQVLARLRQKGIKEAMARSVLSCQAPHGVCAHCAGALPDFKLPHVGYSAGVTAAQAVGEPLAQGSLSSKHTGGVFQSGKKTFSGFDVINQFTQSPETFPHKAAVAEEAGKVSKIEDAPQGGKYIYVGEHRHYALPGYEPTVKPGDDVEAGQIMSEGIADPADIVRLRGLGEGRQYYVQQLGEILKDSGLGRVNKRSLELIARGALDSVRVTADEGLGDYLPDDSVSYSRLMARYSPPKSTELKAVSDAHDHYLQQPVLHFTIGTRLTPKMAKTIRDAGIEQVAVSREAPQFEPEMVRLRGSQYSGEDWFQKLTTSLLSKNIEQDAGRARDTNVEHSFNYAPRLAIGKDFAKNLGKTGEF